MKTKFIEKIPAFFISNYFIALILSVILFFSVDFKFSKYNYEIVEELNKFKTYQNSYYVDLDFDGFFEEVLIFNNKNTGFASVIGYKQGPNAFFQLNLITRLVNENIREFAFDDIDNDNYKEIIFCTHKEDSLFLNIIYSRDSIFYKQYFLDFIEKSKYGDYSYNFSFEMNDLDDDLYNEILLDVFGYFSTSPRKIYLYNVKNDSIISSNTSGNILRSDLLLSDIDNDGMKDITGFTRAPGNIIDQKSVLFSDASCWLMVFNSKLNFLFDPIEEKAEFSTLYNSILNTNENKYILYWVTKEAQSENIIHVINTEGEQIDSVIISTKIFPKLKGIVNAEDDYVYLYNDYGEICLINNEFEIDKIIFRNERNQKLIQAYFPINIDEDTLKEFLILSNDEKIFIAEEYFNNFTEIEVPIINTMGRSIFEIIEKHHLDANLLIQDNEKAVFVKYYKNNFYTLRYLAIPAIYIFVYIVLFLLTYLQRIQLHKKTEREKQLLELQFKTIKNQIEPHFLYNTMTSIGHLIMDEDRFEAYNYLERLASLTRKSLEMADSVAVKLKRELEFIENYLELQKLRFEEKFEYDIIVDPEADLNTKVPKMLLQLHVENAIKHGLMHKKSGGELKISISKLKNVLQCTIEDNGIGLKEPKKYASNSTGKGLEIAQQTIELYKKIHKTNITQEIIDLSELDSSKQGVRVEINIPL